MIHSHLARSKDAGQLITPTLVCYMNDAPLTSWTCSVAGWNSRLSSSMMFFSPSSSSLSCSSCRRSAVQESGRDASRFEGQATELLEASVASLCVCDCCALTRIAGVAIAPLNRLVRWESEPGRRIAPRAVVFLILGLLVL